MQNFSLSDAIKERLQDVEEELGVADRIVSLDCNDIDLWQHREHKEFASADIHTIGQSILEHGQYQPIIVARASEEFMPKDSCDANYVIITGHKRWLACKKHQIPVQALVRGVNVEQVVGMLIYENLSKQQSDFNKGLLCDALLKTNKITPQLLSEKLAMTPTNLNKLLTFSALPDDVCQAIGDLSKVSANTALAIERLLRKGPEYKDAIMAIGDKIAQGYGEARIMKLIAGILAFQQGAELTPKTAHNFKHRGKVLLKQSKANLKLSKEIIKAEKFDNLLGDIEKLVAEFFDSNVKKPD